MTNRQMIRMLRRYLDGSAGPEERARVDKWYADFSDAGVRVPEGAALDGVKEGMFRQIRAVLDGPGIARTIPFYRRAAFRVAAAAAVVLLIGGAGYWGLQRQRHPPEAVVKAPVVHDVAAPDKSLATLTLADGTRIALDSAGSGTLAKQGNTAIKRLPGGQLVYQPEKSVKAGAETMTWNTITVPRGSRIVDLTLADGTRVWLNSASSLRYPAMFDGADRSVELTGEGYFEVARDAAHPFTVERGGMAVRVLGTRFDMNAYADEAAIRVSLLEGLVKVEKDGGGSGLVRPGEQAVVSDGQVKIATGVDMEEVMAWKEGRFQFGDAADIPSVMRQIARWYDVDLEYEGQPGGHIGGTIARTVNVSQVLHMLELTGAVRFRVDGRKVIVL